MAIDRAGKVYWNLGKALAATALAVKPTARTRLNVAPTITSGAGAPTTTEPVGSLWMRTNAPNSDSAIYVSEGSGTWAPLVSLLLAPNNHVIPDPGTGAAIAVTHSGVCAITTAGGGGETNTLPIPVAVGQQVTITLDTDGGADRVITVAAAINQAGNTQITLAAAGDTISLIGTTIAGGRVWRVLQNDGPVLA